MKTVTFDDLQTIDYKKAWDYQEETHKNILEKKKAGIIEFSDNKIIFCEHNHVYTIGKSGEKKNLLISEGFLKKIKATCYKINRGGDITYHGPGQIVGYPILDLELFKIGVKTYIDKLENSIIRTLNEYSISASRLEGSTGVWIDARDSSKVRKICAIGVRVSKFVTMHGFALNVNTDLNYFNYINPCGFTDKGVTSMQKELGESLDSVKVKKTLKKLLSDEFKISFI